MRFDVLTLFPEIFDGYRSQSLLKLAIERDLVELHTWNIRDHTEDKHQKVDDRPFGGGPGCSSPANRSTTASRPCSRKGHRPGIS